MNELLDLALLPARVYVRVFLNITDTLMSSTGEAYHALARFAQRVG